MYNMYIYIRHKTIKTGIEPPRLAFVICLENVIEACLYLFVLIYCINNGKRVFDRTAPGIMIPFFCQCVMLYVIMHHRVHH